MSLGRFSECEGASTVIPNVASYPCSLDSACHSERLAAVPFAILLLDRAARSRGTLRCASIALTCYPISASFGRCGSESPSERSNIPSTNLFLKAAQLQPRKQAGNFKSTPARPSSTPTDTQRSVSPGTPASPPVRIAPASCTALPTGTGRLSRHRTPRTESR